MVDTDKDSVSAAGAPEPRDTGYRWYVLSVLVVV